MRVLTKISLLLFCGVYSHLSAFQGLVTRLYDDVETMRLSLANQIYNLGVKLPIEVWVEKDKHTKEAIEQIEKFEQVTIRDLQSYQEDELFYILTNSMFDECVWFSQELVFLRSPEELLKDVGYTENGLFFFQIYPKDHWTQGELLLARSQIREVRTKLLDVVGYVPFDFLDQVFGPLNQIMTKSLQFASDLLLVVNREKVTKGLDVAKKLRRVEELSFVKGIDLLWMGVALSHETFHLNYMQEVSLENARKDGNEVKAQLYRGKLFALNNRFVGGIDQARLKSPLDFAIRQLLPSEKASLHKAFDMYCKGFGNE